MLKTGYETCFLLSQVSYNTPALPSLFHHVISASHLHCTQFSACSAASEHLFFLGLSPSVSSLPLHYQPLFLLSPGVPFPHAVTPSKAPLAFSPSQVAIKQ